MRRALLLILLCLPTFFFFIGSGAITDSDEAYYAESAREMVERGDWITPHFNYRVRFEKPILFYWLVAGTYALTGVGEGAARFWAAMSGVGLVLVAFAVARRWVDEDTAMPAGLVTATSFAAAAMARQSLPDLPLAFFITLAVWSGFEALSSGDHPSSRLTRRGWLLISAASCALAVLTKGPIGVALPVLILIPPLILERVRPPGRRGLPVTGADLALALVVFLIVSVPWFAIVTWVHGPGYLYRFFVGENLDRFATARYNDPRPLWFYLPILIGGLLPWTPFALLWMRKSTASVTFGTRSRELLRLASWAVVPLVVFSISVGKQPRYVLPCLVPLAVILGTAIASRVRATLGGRRDLLLTVAGCLSAAIVGVAGLLLYRIAPIVASDQGISARSWGVVVMAGSLVALLASLPRSARLMPAGIAIAASLTLVALNASLGGGSRADAVVEVAGVITQQAAAGERICACGAFLRNLPFYVKREVMPAGTQAEVNAALTSGESVIAAVDAQKLAAAEAQMQLRVERLAEVPYLNTALLRLDDFVSPDPQRVLQRIVVIRTR